MIGGGLRPVASARSSPPAPCCSPGCARTDAVRRSPFAARGAAAGARDRAVNGADGHAAEGQPVRRDARHASAFGGAGVIYSHSSPIVDDKPGFERSAQDLLAGCRSRSWMLVVALRRRRRRAGQDASTGARCTRSAATTRRRGWPACAWTALRAITYVACGACAALGGAIIASRLRSARPTSARPSRWTRSRSWSSAGPRCFGGEGAVWRTAVGLLILAMINNLF